MNHRANRTTSALCLAVIVLGTGCASDKDPVAVTVPPTAPSTSPAEPTTSQTPFTSRTFAIPFTATVPGLFKPAPTEDTRTLVSWAAADGERYIRVLLPAVLYRPDSTSPQQPPADYLSYLRSLTSAGAAFTNETSTTVDGHSATLVTASTTRSLDGTLGCPGPQTPIEVCFGLQPDLALRIAVIPVGTSTVIAWVRTEQDDPEAATYVAAFESMLSQAQLG
ncbi:hypothetical protein [Kribbella lupini]|uniref:Lipoprotein LpqN n=1 Tax=Kribbella lupini TaxID=291602 RepID=A0ABN2AZ54_9ACTN